MLLNLRWILDSRCVQDLQHLPTSPDQTTDPIAAVSNAPLQTGAAAVVVVEERCTAIWTTSPGTIWCTHI